MNGYITEDEVLGINLVDEDYYYLDLVIKQNLKDKEFIPDVEILKTDLPVIYRDVYQIHILINNYIVAFINKKREVIIYFY